jgi:ubiquinone/menaquinone biosynthesis C-methylase UbiE
MLQSVAYELAVKETETFLDIGCGTGNLLPYIPKKSIVVASDFASEALSIANKKNKPNNCTFLNINLMDPLPFDNATFNKIAMVNVLYAFDSHRQTDILCELKRILKNGGKVTIVMPRSDASRFKVLNTHLKKSVSKKGLIKTVCFLFRSFYKLFLMSKYNKVIESRAKKQQYCFWEKRSFIDLLTSLDFYDICATEIYAKQAFMYSFRS